MRTISRQIGHNSGTQPVPLAPEPRGRSFPDVPSRCSNVDGSQAAAGTPPLVASGRHSPREDSTPVITGVGSTVGLIRSGPFKGLARDGYDLIMADPAWMFHVYSEKGIAKNPQAHYDCMSIDAIKAMPVAQLAAPNCLLWLWCTNPIIDQAIEVLRAWSFTFKTAGTWVKRTKNGVLHFGIGYHLRSANEPFLIGTIGSPQTANNVRSAIEGVVREHSRKPEEAFAAAEQLMPHARRLELFSRQARPGWTGWGDQADHFDRAAS